MRRGVSRVCHRNLTRDHAKDLRGLKPRTPQNGIDIEISQDVNERKKQARILGLSPST